MENKDILVIQNLTKKYGERLAVNNATFTVHAGEIFGFLGANGAGKSTLIKMLTGLTSISFGDAFICGYSVKTHFEKAISNVGAMIEVPHFYSYLSAFNNLKYFSKLSGNFDKNHIMDIAKTVGLENRIYDKVSSYSLGMKQRLGVACALLNNPKVLILDEPTNGLDVNGIREFRIMLKNLAKNKGICIFISSHILSEMESLCDMIAIIDQGNIIEFKSLDEIRKSVTMYGSLYVKVNAPNFAGKIIKENFDIDVKINNDKILFSGGEKILSKIIVLLTQKKVMVFGAGQVDYSLEEIFLNAINKGKSQTSIS